MNSLVLKTIRNVSCFNDKSAFNYGNIGICLMFGAKRRCFSLDNRQSEGQVDRIVLICRLYLHVFTFFGFDSVYGLFRYDCVVIFE